MPHSTAATIKPGHGARRARAGTRWFATGVWAVAIAFAIFGLLFPGGDPAVVRPDSEIAAAVQQAMHHDPRIPDDVRIDVRDGTVTLSGTVPTDASKELAARRAQQVRGAHRIINALHVRGH